MSVDRELQRWGEGKPAGVFLAALMVAGGAAEFYQVLRLVRCGKGVPDAFGSPPQLDVWLRFYRKHRLIENLLGELGGLGPREDGAGAEVVRFVAAMARLPRSDREARLRGVSKEEWRLAFAEIQRAFRRVFAEAVAVAKGGELPEGAGNPGVLASREEQFLLRVIVPCWIEHRQHPYRLFRAARLGDSEALDKLLRIDKSILGDPRIASHWHEAAHSSEQARFRRLAEAVCGRPVGSCTLPKIKRALAGLVSEFAKQLGHEITEPEWRKLFDLVARARGGRIDTDLPATPDTLAKGIRRERKRWEPFLEGGQKSNRVLSGR